MDSLDAATRTKRNAKYDTENLHTGKCKGAAILKYALRLKEKPLEASVDEPHAEKTDGPSMK